MSYLTLSLPRLLLATGFIGLAIWIARRLGLGLGRDLAIGALRAAVQLITIGYVLSFVFGHAHPWTVLPLVAAMLLVAGWTSARRIAHGPGAAALFPWALGSVAAAGAAALLPAVGLIVPSNPWYAPQILIPLSGMMLSNAMNVSAQVFERVFAQVDSEADLVEQLLALGATPQQALARQTRSAVRAALVPTINGLLTVGLVALPGMMSGQILGGASPTQAVRYQLMVMYQLAVVAAVAGALSARAAQRLLFTPQDQLRRFPPSTQA